MSKIKHPKRKGKRLEEKVAKIIRELWNIEKEDKIHRSFTSGIISFERGDIKFNLEHNPHIWIECKNREEWSIEDLIKFKNPIKDYFKKVIKDINKKSEIFLPILVIDKAFLIRSYVITIYELFFNETFLTKCNLYLDKEMFNNSDFIIYIKVDKNDILNRECILENYIINKNSDKLTMLVMYIDDFFKSIKPLII